MNTETQVEKALFRFLIENERIPTRTELAAFARVEPAHFERTVSKNEVFEMLWKLNAEEEAILVERVASHEDDGPHSLKRLLYMIAESQLASVKKSLDSRGRE